jgi:antitoxin component YwqK of YwqJK toxin-antitoxin module
MTESIIPLHAEERVEQTYPGGARKAASYYLNNYRIGFRVWAEHGAVELEYGCNGDLQHGPFRRWNEDGTLLHETAYLDNKEHGVSWQYGQDGEIVGIYVMHHGTGRDLWYSCAGVLSEERSYYDGQRHGYERWWNGDNLTVWEESHFHHGVEHGIFRRWNKVGRLCRGYPQYFANGTLIDRRRYLRACRTDPTLPPFLAENNAPQRVLPPIPELERSA